MEEELDAAFVGVGHHVLGCHLGEHDVRRLRHDAPGLLHEGDPVHLRHQQVHHHDVRPQDRQVLQGVGRVLRAAADLSQLPLVDDDPEDIDNRGAVVDQIESHGDTSRDVVGMETQKEVLSSQASTRMVPWSSCSVRSRTRQRPIPLPTWPVV